MTVRARAGVLISGRGSNLAALIEAAKEDGYPADIALVISNVAGAPGLDLARAAGIATLVVPHDSAPDRQTFGDMLTAALELGGVDLVCNAGFMRLHPAAFVRRWQGRQLNIHPSLLPAFPGLHPQNQALAAGVRISGCTVHFVSEKTDAGPIVAQAAVPVLPGDTVQMLTARILSAEHRLYPLALRLVASGEAVLNADRVVFSGTAAAPFIFASHPPNRDAH